MKKLILALFVISFIVGSIKLYATYFCTITHYTCAIDSFLSDECCASIEHAVAELAGKRAGACAIIGGLQKKFPVIRKVAITYNPHEAQIAVHAHRPRSVVNDLFVFTCHDHIFPKAEFSDFSISRVPAVYVCQESMPRASQLLSAAFAQLPATFYSTHDLVIGDKHCLQLKDREQPCFSIKITADQPICAATLLQCEHIKKTMTEKKAFDKKAEWVADVRFADYVIAYKT